ncbi:MAG TPA: ParB/RepB/Spo0J family partition protein [Actinopolymorphaceae bacterium]
MSVRRGLGKGLGALIPTAPTPQATPPGDPAAPSGPGATAPGATVPRETPPAAATEAQADMATVDGARFAEISLDAITPNPRQPRQVFDEEALAELVHSIREIGLLQPIVVRRLAAERYELVMGERRWRAAREAGLTAIPAIIRETGDDAMLRDALLENLHRAQLNPLEEAAAYGQLLEDFGCTHDELAQRIGRSRPQITNTLRLLKLPPSIQRRVAAGVLSAGHARALLAVSDPAQQEHLAHRVVAEGMSVRALEELVALDGASPQRKQRAPRPPQPVAPKLADLEGRLADRFDTRVKVDLGRSKGKITVEFASLEDLERIVGLMDPSREAGGPASGPAVG